MGYGKYNTTEQRNLQRQINYLKTEQKKLADRKQHLDTKLTKCLTQLEGFNITYGKVTI